MVWVCDSKLSLEYSVGFLKINPGIFGRFFQILFLVDIDTDTDLSGAHCFSIGHRWYFSILHKDSELIELMVKAWWNC